MAEEQLFVLDAVDQPLALLDADEIHRQNLRHRGCMLIITDRKKRILLRKLDGAHPQFSGKWDIMGYGHISGEKAAEDTLENFLPEPLRHMEYEAARLGILDAAAGTGNERVEVYSIRLTTEQAEQCAREPGLRLIDADELQTMFTHYSDQLTPALRIAQEKNILAQLI